MVDFRTMDAPAPKNGNAKSRQRPEVYELVAKMLSAMLSPGEITRRLRATHGVSEPLVIRYVRQVRAEWAKAASGTVAEMRVDMLARLAYLYQMSLASKDTRAALGVLREISRVCGLYAPEVVKVESSVLTGIDATDPDKARDMMAAVIRRHARDLADLLPEQVQLAKPGEQN